MTKEEILAMEAGRELDAKVSIEIFSTDVYWFDGEAYRLGGEWEFSRPPAGYFPASPQLPSIEYIPRYSTDISAAWQVVEKICNWDVDDNMLILKGQAPDLESKDEDGIGWWEAEINGTWGKVIAEGKAAPEAICKAALLTRLEEDKDE